MCTALLKSKDQKQSVLIEVKSQLQYSIISVFKPCSILFELSNEY